MNHRYDTHKVACSGLALLLLAGCAHAPLSSRTSQEAVPAIAGLRLQTPLAESEAKVWAALCAMTDLGTMSVRRVQATSSQDVTTEGSFYAGPFPTAGALDATYLQRPSGGRFGVNPSVTTENGITTTETYWTPDGDLKSPAAYSKVVSANGVTTLDLYAAPPAPTPGLPAYFAEKLTLPADVEVERAEETYRVYQQGPIAGTALGYRWAVFGQGRRLLAWIRAFQVTTQDGRRIDCHQIFSDYETVNGAVKPTRYAYQSYDEASRSGVTLDQTLDPATGVWTGDGSWEDVAANKTLNYTETIQPGGQVHRDLVLALDASTRLQIAEDYAPNQAGTATISVNGAATANGAWPTSGLGSVTFSSGAVRAYQPSRFRYLMGTVLDTWTLDLAAVGITIDPTGSLWSASGETVTMRAHDSSVVGSFNLDWTPSDLAADPSGGLWVATREGDKRKKCKVPPGNANGHDTNGKAACAAKYLIARFTESGALLFENEVAEAPDALTVDSQGNLWAASTAGNRVYKFSSQGVQLGAFDVGTEPVALSVDRTGTLWVANRGSRDVAKVSSDGQVLARYALGVAPTAIAAIASGGVWVATGADKRVIRLSTSGGVAGSYSAADTPNDVVADAFGNAWVSFGTTARVSVYSR